MMLRNAARLVLIFTCTLQASCAWLFPQRTGAFHDGYRSGCSAGESQRGMQARDSDARTHLQEEYRQGWSSGYVACSRKRDADDEDKKRNAQQYEKQRAERCERTHKRRDCR